MKRESSWKDLGRFNSTLLNLFAIIREVLAGMEIGIEIVGWLVGEGKEVFAENFTGLIQQFVRLFFCDKIKAVAGKHAGDHGFPLPNPVSIY